MATLQSLEARINNLEAALAAAEDKKISELDPYTTPVSGDQIAIVDTASDATKKVDFSDLIFLIKTANDAYIGGDQSGDPRGNDALDVQSGRVSPTQVASGEASTAIGRRNIASGVSGTAVGYNNTASGISSTALGNGNTASDGSSSAVGNGNMASGISSSAVGDSNTASDQSSSVGFSNAASGISSTAIGFDNAASGDFSTALGYISAASAPFSTAVGHSNIASGNSSSAFGMRVQVAADNAAEFGWWVNAGSRSGSIRAHENGQIALTIEDSATAPTDGGATDGSEINGTLPRGMITFQTNGNDLICYRNNGGTIQSINLGTFA